MTYHLIIWMESSECWHEVDEITVPIAGRRDPLRYAIAIARNTHPRLRGQWAVVAERDLAEAMASDPRPTNWNRFLLKSGYYSRYLADGLAG